MSNLSNKRYSIQPFTAFGSSSKSFEDELLGQLTSSGLEDTSQFLKSAKDDRVNYDSSLRELDSNSAGVSSGVHTFRSSMEFNSITTNEPFDSNKSPTSNKAKNLLKINHTTPTTTIISTTELSPKKNNYERVHDDNVNSAAAKLRKKLMRRSVLINSDAFQTNGNKYSKPPKSRLQEI
ncbi:hypothetical protein BB561_001351 [Smittium simulii]|uniref:Uncharacterized protein n=1 Tax=Smittium simulii TaxID=133385 RepID=A0A2T9YV26_9FUNG|nr:hypothetical protein BB561_001351 [Smittium simulii]